MAGAAARYLMDNPNSSPAQVREALVNAGECADGSVHGGNGCSTEWPGDPDADTASLNEPLLKVGSPVVGITTTDLPSGVVDSAYSQTLTATGGTTPYTWSIAAGSLSADLSLDACSGVISGTPTAADTSSFTVQATASSSPVQTDTQALSITVDAETGVCPSSMSYGQNAECSISVEGEQDSYTFTGAPGERAYVRIAKKGSTGLTSPAVEIHRHNDTLLCSNSGTYTASVNCLLDRTGTHTVLAMGAIR